MLPTWTHILTAIWPENPDISDQAARGKVRGWDS